MPGTKKELPEKLRSLFDDEPCFYGKMHDLINNEYTDEEKWRKMYYTLYRDCVLFIRKSITELNAGIDRNDIKERSRLSYACLVFFGEMGVAGLASMFDILHNLPDDAEGFEEMIRPMIEAGADSLHHVSKFRKRFNGDPEGFNEACRKITEALKKGKS